jgi:Ulp1 family protease
MISSKILKIYIPYNIENLHWILCLVIQKKGYKNFLIFDSMQKQNKVEYYEKLFFNFAKIAEKAGDEIVFKICKCYQQKDNYNCGVFVLRIIQEIEKISSVLINNIGKYI